MQGNVVTTTEKKSPAEIIQIAVQSGANLAELREAMKLQFEFEANEARKAFHQAMTNFKSNPIEIDKDKEVSFGNTHYTHATLANVVRTITKELSKHGLSASWRTEQQEAKVCVSCKITHVMGHSEETMLCAPSDTSGAKNAIQAMGSTVTYLQRYTLLSITGLATSDQPDDDGNAATEFINAWQVGDLQKLLKEKPWLTEANFLKYMGVSKIEEIPAIQYTKAEQAIKSAKKKEDAK